MTAEAIGTAAERLAAAAVTNLASLLPCDPAQVGEAPCLKQFVVAFGRRAFRRPLSATEVTAFEALAAKGRGAGPLSLGVQTIIEGMLQSPHFLYRLDGGAPAGGPATIVVDGHQMASRLSYLFWASMPDDELLAAAAAGSLTTPAGIEAQARRLLASPKAAQGWAAFHVQWLGADHVQTLDKDRAIFPAFNADLAASMKTELERVFAAAAADPKVTLGTLLTSSHTFADDALASLYGASGGSKSFPRLDLDPRQRSGLLTSAAVLASHAKANQSSPVLRGKFVREQFFCQVPPAPPPEVNNTAPSPDPRLPTRVRFAEHRENPACASCHELMDPIGFGFEAYDGIGRFRTMDGDQPVDSSGSLVGTDVDGPFDGAIALAEKLTASRAAAACYAQQWARHALAASAASADCAAAELAASAAAGEPLRELLVRLVKLEAFRTLRAR